MMDLEQEWDKFNKKLHIGTNPEKISRMQTPKQTQHKSNTETIREGATANSKIVLIIGGSGILIDAFNNPRFRSTWGMSLID